MSKISTRFFNDKEVRAIWDEESNKWWFSVMIIELTKCVTNGAIFNLANTQYVI